MTEATETERKASTGSGPRRRPSRRRRSRWAIAAERIGGVILALTVLALLYGVIWLIQNPNDTTPRNPCEGQNAETGMSEECKDFVETLDDDPGKIQLMPPPQAVVRVQVPTPPS